ncbi:NAD(P)/FAD-dependent oxidoreductase [Gordonia caeni]|uniref:FAD-dependent oxidoreductase n=1 Tax=Gordonia caeni TaxID=1007097 RepID=A0ABP7NPP6_9ACTN
MTPTAGAVIVGSGVAGATAAQTLRAEGFAGPVTIVGGEPGLPYRRTALSKDLLGADLRPDRISLLKPAAWADKEIEILGGTRVLDVDAPRRTVDLDDGTTLAYRVLVLATGGQPIRPAWLEEDVLALRTVGDAERIRSAINSSGALVVIGGGLIGLELAASAAAAGHAVTVLEAADRVMNRVVPPEVSEFVESLHRDNGVDVRCGSRVVRAGADGVELEDGSTVRGTVVAAVGMAPEVGLAAGVGVRVSDGGIVVDEALRTDVSGIYAAGDAVVVSDPLTGDPARCEHWFGALDQGAVVARSIIADLAGEPAPVYAEVPRAWTVQYGVNVQIVGRPTAAGEVLVDGSLAERSATVTVTGPGGLLGAVTVGRAAAARTLRAQIAAGLGSAV